MQFDPNFLYEGGSGHKLLIYQILPRLFTNTNSTNKKWGSIKENGVGKFKDINKKALQAIKDMGITHIWYTGVLEHATLTDYSDFGIPHDHPEIVKGRAGSPYAIKDYYDVSPDLAVKVPKRMQEFEALVQRTHKEGLKVIIDFVPNHVARYYYSDQQVEGREDFGAKDKLDQSFNPENNYYYYPGQKLVVPDTNDALNQAAIQKLVKTPYEEYPAKATGNDVFSPQPGINDWFETVKLNYGVDYLNNKAQHFDPIPDTWYKMEHILLYWAAKGIDAFRCDMAFMVPGEFWNWVIQRVKAKYPDIIFIAEIYDETLYRYFIEYAGFDYLYDKVQLYDTLKKIVQQNGSTHWLTGIWQNLRGINKHMLRFLENHDEQRIASPDFAGNPFLALPALFVSATWHKGPLMLYFGQEVGEPGAGESGFSKEDGRTTIFDYWGVPEHQKWLNKGAFDGGQLSKKQKELRSYHQQLLQFCLSSEAIKDGEFYDLQAHMMDQEGYNDKVLTYLRFTAKDKVLCISNFHPKHNAQFRLYMPKEVLAALDRKSAFQLKGIFGTTVSLSYRNGVDINIPPLGSFIFKF